MKNKFLFILSVLSLIGSIAVISGASEYVYDQNGILKYKFEEPLKIIVKEEVEQESLAGGFIGLVVGGVLAMKIAPIFFNATATLETDSAGDLSTDEESLVGILPYMLIFGIIGMVVGGIAI